MSAATALVLRESPDARSLRRRSLQMVLSACDSQQWRPASDGTRVLTLQYSRLPRCVSSAR